MKNLLTVYRYNPTNENLAACFLKYNDKLVKSLTDCVVNGKSPEDVVAELWLKLPKSIHLYKGNSPLAYLKTGVRNLQRTEAKRHKNYIRKLDDIFSKMANIKESSIDSVLLESKIELLKKLAQKLPEHFQSVVNARLDGKKMRDIQIIESQLSTSILNMRWLRAKKLLAKYYEEHIKDNPLEGRRDEKLCWEIS